MTPTTTGITSDQPLLPELFEEAASAPFELTFLPATRTLSSADLWSLSARSAGWLGENLDAAEPVAMVLDSTPDALAALLGSWRSGRRVISLPPPPRGSSIEQFQGFVERSCEVSDASMLLVSAEYERFLPPLRPAVHSFEATTTQAAPRRHLHESPADGELVQFTSGSTGEPKGVLLGMAELSAAVLGILEVLQPGSNDVACSWLPLSHDMGLVGMALTSIAAGGKRYADGGSIVFIKPEHFLMRPESWLQACSRFRSTITAAPNFGFDHAVRRANTTSQTLDLSSLRVCITGAEPVQPSTLRAFGAAFEPAGFSATAFCPAYGLAEAGLAVTITPPEAHWSSITVDEIALMNGEVTTASHSAGGVEIVSAGAPLSGVELRSQPADTVDVVGIRGQSTFCGYVPDDTQRPRHEWFETEDLGFLRNGELYLAGRRDDVIQVAGRNVSLDRIDRATATALGVPVGRVQATSMRGSEYIIVVEQSGLRSAQEDATIAAAAAVAAVGWRPERILITERGQLPRTPSGKPRRVELVRQIREDELNPLHETAKL